MTLEKVRNRCCAILVGSSSSLVRPRRLLFDKPRRDAPPTSGLHPRGREVMFSRRLDLLGLNLLDHALLGRDLCRLSGAGAKRKRRTDG